MNSDSGIDFQYATGWMVTRNLQITFFFLLLHASVVWSQTSSPNTLTNKPKIGVMKFEVDPELKPGLGIFVYNGLMDQLVQSKQFTVVDWEQIDRVLNCLSKSQPTLSPDDARKQAIHQLGLEKMCVGSLSKLGTKINVSVKVLNLDLTVAATKRVTVAGEEELEAALAEIAPAVVSGALPTDEAEKYLAQAKQQQAVAPANPASVSNPAQNAPATATKADPFVNSLGMKFVPVPRTKVLFCIWETRVKDFEVFANDANRHLAKPAFEQGPTHPAVCVSWEEANSFCEWLTTREQATGRIGRAQKYRLPSDEEWSVAVRLPSETGSSPAAKSNRIKGRLSLGERVAAILFGGKLRRESRWLLEHFNMR